MTGDDIKAIGLSQVQAAELLGLAPNTVWRQLAGKLPTSGALQYLAATWPLLTDEQRDQVRRELAAVRATERADV